MNVTSLQLIGDKLSQRVNTRPVWYSRERVNVVYEVDFRSVLFTTP